MRPLRWIGALGACLLACSQRPPDDVSYQRELGSTAASADRRWTQFDEQLVAPVWSGDDDRGSLVAPLYRGAAVAMEDFVFVPPDHDCTDSRATLRIDWDSHKNQVHYQVKYKKVPVHPSVHRTEGVDFFTNRAHKSPASFDNGGFRFWTILTGPTGLTKKFYYDFTTFQFVGSEYDFPNGPPPTAFRAPSAADEAWARDGAYLVFRQMRQDVAAFWAYCNGQADILARGPLLNATAEMVGALIVGRWRDGSPIRLDDPDGGRSRPTCRTTRSASAVRSEPTRARSTRGPARSPIRARSTSACCDAASRTAKRCRGSSDAATRSAGCCSSPT